MDADRTSGTPRIAARRLASLGLMALGNQLQQSVLLHFRHSAKTKHEVFFFFRQTRAEALLNIREHRRLNGALECEVRQTVQRVVQTHDYFGVSATAIETRRLVDSKPQARRTTHDEPIPWFFHVANASLQAFSASLAVEC